MRSKTKKFFWRMVLIFLVVIVLAIPLAAVHAQAGDGAPASQVPKLTTDILVTVAGVVLSLLAYVVPPFRRFQERLGEWTPAFMAGTLLVVAVGYQFLYCLYSLECVLANWQTIVLIWGTAFATNSGFYSAVIKQKKATAKMVAAIPVESRLDKIRADR
jgi:hypothetical protein